MRNCAHDQPGVLTLHACTSDGDMRCYWLWSSWLHVPVLSPHVADTHGHELLNSISVVSFQSTSPNAAYSPALHCAVGYMLFTEAADMHVTMCISQLPPDIEHLSASNTCSHSSHSKSKTLSGMRRLRCIPNSSSESCESTAASTTFMWWHTPAWAPASC